VAYGSDANQFIDLRMPKAAGAHPIAICIHGGYWRARYDLEYLGHLCAALTAQGMATANLEYRRVGNPGGGWPGTFEDIRAAYQFLLQNAERYGFDRRKMMVLGHSAGGELALCLVAHEAGLAAAVSLAGVVDLERAYDLRLSNDAVAEFLGGTPAEVPEHYREADPMKVAIRTPQWLVYGAQDDIVPPALSRNYVDAKLKSKEDAQPVAIPGAGHFDVVDPRSGAWAQVEKVLVDSLRKVQTQKESGSTGQGSSV
jgi:acetyl esterase/lipase